MIESRTTRQFWRLFSALPLDIQRDAKRAYRLFQNNPAHPGLQFKKLAGEEDIYSVRIGLEYRAVAVDWQSLRLRTLALSVADYVLRRTSMMGTINPTAERRGSEPIN